MKKLAVGAVAFAGVVLAATGALAVDGCPTGQQTTTVSPDGKSYSLLFNSFASFGDVVTCTFSFPLAPTVPSGSIVVYSADYRGSYDAAGGEVKFQVTHNGTTDGATFVDPDFADPALLHSNIVASSNGKVSSTAGMDTTNGNTFGTFDSADYTELGTITLGTDQTAMVTHFGATAELLTGGTQPTEGGNEVGLIGGYGSAMLGAVGRYNIAEGFSLLSGVSLLDQAAGATTSKGVVGAIAVRYVDPNINTFRPFAEGGLVLGGFQTTHVNVAMAVPTGLASVYAKGGVIFDMAPEARLSLFGTISESALSTAAFTQTFLAFSVNVPAQTGYFTTAKATTAFTYDITPEVDVTAEASIGSVMSHTGITATIPGLGTVSASQNNTFVQYGARIGWEPMDALRLEGFAQGTTGPDIGAHNMVGVGAKFEF